MATTMDPNHDVATTRPKENAWLTFRNYIWDSDTHLKSPEERALLFKLDCSILTCLCFGWLMKYIDQTNLAAAYVSGMKEDLNIQGNEYTYMQSIYTIAITVMQVPSNLIVLKVRPSYFLAFCELGWTAFTFAQAGAQNTTQMYVFRLFVGIFEAAFLPVSVFLMSSWYTPTELGKRVSIFFTAATLGSAFSKFMQAAIYSTLDKKLGLAGWRWLYIICGCMTLPCGFALFWFLPDYPAKPGVWFLTDAEAELGRQRAAASGKAPIRETFNLRNFKTVFTTWRWWTIVPAYTVLALSLQHKEYFAIWLANNGYTVTQRNIFPAITNLVTVPTVLFYGIMSDRTGYRLPFILGPGLYGIIPIAILIAYPANKAVMLYAFLTCTLQIATPVFWTWGQEVCNDSAEERAIVIASMNGMFSAMNAWISILIYPQTDAPRFKKGFRSDMGFIIAGMLLTILIWYLHKRETARKQARSEAAAAEEGARAGYYEAEEKEKNLESPAVVVLSAQRD